MSREETIDYAESHGIAVTVSRDRIYSIDANIWGRAIECGILEDPWAPRLRTSSRDSAVATEPVEVAVGFEHGVPVSIDGVELGLVELGGRDRAPGRVGRFRARRHGRRTPRRHQGREIYECPPRSR